MQGVNIIKWLARDKKVDEIKRIANMQPQEILS